jgi:DNA-binding SARP family transcriptional activator
MNIWRAYFFGNFRLITPNDEPINLSSPTIRSLLAYLILNREQPADRRRLAYLFWPRGTETAARRNLRQYLHRIRRLTPEPDHDTPLVLSSGSIVQFNPEIIISSDIQKFTHYTRPEANIEELISCVSLYSGDLLEDVYEDWINPLREQYSQRMFQAMERLSSKLQTLGRFEEAIQFTHKQINFDPYNEAVHRNLISLYYQNNERNKAVEHYNQLTDILNNDLGIPPLPETEELIEAIQQGRYQVGQPTSQIRKDSESLQKLDYSIPLIGRESEISNLDQALSQGQQRQGNFILITGESGIGKTRLVQEFLDRHQDLSVISVLCHELDVNSPYTPVREMLEKAIPMLPEEKSISTRTLSAAISLAPALSQKYPNISNGRHPVNITYQDALVELFSKVAEQGQNNSLILIIDNLQWADSLSWNLLVQFARQLGALPILLIGLCRNEDLFAERQQLIRTFHRNQLVNEIALPRLSATHTKRIAEQILPSSNLDEEFYIQLHNETEGIPLFIIEMLKSQKESGKPLGLKSLSAQQGMPAGIRQIIDSRLDRLSNECKDVLASAAVIGREFTFSFLTEISDFSSEDIIIHLEEIGSRGLIREVNQGYDFSHDKIRQVAYNNLSKARRQYYHRRVAEALESAIPPSSPATLAHHYSSSDTPIKALPYFIKAGEDAIRSRSYLEARQIGHQAVNLLGRVPGPEQRAERIDLNLQLAQAYAFSGDFKQAMEVMNFTEQIAAKLDDQTRQGQVYYRSAQIFWQVGQSLAAGDYARRALRTAEELGDDDLLLASLRMLGRVGIALSTYDDAIAYLLRYINMAKNKYPAPPLFSVLGYLGVAYGRVGSWRRGFEMAKKGVELAQSEGIPETISFAKMQLAFLYADNKEWKETLTIANQFIDSTGEYQVLTPSQFILLAVRGRALGHTGEPKLGIEAIQTALRWAEQTDYRIFVYLPQLYLVECYIEAGQVQNAIQTGERVLQVTLESNNPWAVAQAYKLLAQAHTMSSQPDYPKVEDYLITARNLLRQVRCRPDLAHTYLALRKLYDRAGQIAWAVDCHFRATSIFEECGMSKELAKAQGMASRERTGAVVIPNLSLKGPNQGEDSTL